MTELTVQTLDEWRHAIQTHPRLMLFKHSPICPVSHAAREQWQRFLDANPEATTAEVDVIAARPAARGLAEACGVAHQSPQAILFVDGSPAWDASHHQITRDSLAAAWAG